MSDPRYDPRFQRGWDGVVPPVPDAPPTAPPEPARTPAPAAPVEPAPTAAAADFPAAAPDDEAEPEPTGRNPFRIALFLLGAVLIIAAASLLWQQLQTVSSSQGPADVVFQQVIYIFGPMLMLAGIVSIVVAVATLAVRRR
jgi:hypothetical protein